MLNVKKIRVNLKRAKTLKETRNIAYYLLGYAVTTEFILTSVKKGRAKTARRQVKEDAYI